MTGEFERRGRRDHAEDAEEDKKTFEVEIKKISFPLLRLLRNFCVLCVQKIFCTQTIKLAIAASNLAEFDVDGF